MDACVRGLLFVCLLPTVAFADIDLGTGSGYTNTEGLHVMALSYTHAQKYVGGIEYAREDGFGRALTI